MTEQMHKRLTEEQVVMILERYIKKELSREHAMDLLGLKRRQFFVKKQEKKTRKGSGLYFYYLSFTILLIVV